MIHKQAHFICIIGGDVGNGETTTASMFDHARMCLQTQERKDSRLLGDTWHKTINNAHFLENKSINHIPSMPNGLLMT
jgi:hypothetical protein